MTKLEQVVETMKRLPSEVQDELADLVLSYESGVFKFSAAESAELDARLADTTELAVQELFAGYEG